MQAVRPATYRLMELLAEAPAILLGRRTDILAVNDAARAVFTNFTALPARERNDRAAASRAADRRYFLAEIRIAREPLPVPADSSVHNWVLCARRAVDLARLRATQNRDIATDASALW